MAYSKAPTAVVKTKDVMKYAGTIYVAGMGDYSVEADGNIDTSSDQPIKINSLVTKVNY